MELYADIILPIALQPLTYLLPAELVGKVGVGDGVEVTIGARKRYMGIVLRIHSSRPDYKRIKAVERVLYGGGLVSEMQLALWQWMAEYYMTPLGEVMRVALPSALKPSGLSGEEFSERIVERRSEVTVRLHSRYVADEVALGEILDKMARRAKVRYGLLMQLLGRLSERGDMAGEVAVRSLGGMSPQIHKLVEEGVVVLGSREVDMFATEGILHLCKGLSEAQQRTLDGIEAQSQARSTTLLHGVTGSGKTEIYTHLIAKELAEGRSVLYLLPEIAVTEQFIGRMEECFGDCVVVYHSKLTPSRRAQIYLNISHSDRPLVVVGVRSSIFLPIKSLGLIIVDEEHDRSFKQEDFAPRYSARDSAVWLAHKFGIRTLLGSATPSVESYRNALAGRYGFVELTERFGEARLPRITLSDTRRAAKRGERKGHINKELHDLMQSAFESGRQVMLFQNRRGFAPYVECEECGASVRCPMCSVTLSYHKSDNSLRCHHCGHRTPTPEVCPECGKGRLLPQGFGTEKIEEELARLFPEALAARLDADVATSPSRYGAIIKDFASGKSDILVGTQMITKGFDFAGVSVVGVLNADNLLNFPDFRSSERAFQTLTQIAGRAGRTDSEGQVVIQTSEPENPTLARVVSGDYRAMYEEEVALREAFGYPPFSREVLLTFRHNEPLRAEQTARRVSAMLLSHPSMTIVGPYPPPLEQLSGMWLSCLTIRLKGGSASDGKRAISAALESLAKDKRTASVKITVDVDPQ